MIELTPYFSELMINVSQDWGFLDETLSPISKTDPFLKMLLDLREHEVSQSRQLLVQRNDFFLIKDDIGKGGHDSSSSGEDTSASALRQVEINTVSASFPFLITQLTRLHQHIFEQIIPNNPLKPVVDSFAKAIKDYGSTDAIMLLVSQPAESNRFDQLGLEQLLWDEYKIQTVRKTLTEIYENGSLSEGHLILAGKKVAITYYRAGYTPEDFNTSGAIKGRQLIEASSTIQVPDLAMQLAGMKKIQQVLTRPEILSNFVSEEISKRFRKTFVGMHSLDEIIETPEGEISASEWASINPEKYVLKPQREGGGNNYFGSDILKLIPTIKKEEQKAYIMMEKIQALPHSSLQIVNGQAETLNCVSEIGRFGVCFAENGEIKNNLDAGYLVRTKARNVNEGGVCSGFACLNTITGFD